MALPPLAQRFAGRLQSRGLTNPYALAAVLATGKHESGWKPGNVYGQWSDPSERGAPGTSGGALSWRAERLARLRRGGKLPEIEGQADYFLSEDPGLISRLQAAKSPEEAQQLMNNAWRFAGYNRPGGEAAARIRSARLMASVLGGDVPEFDDEQITTGTHGESSGDSSMASIFQQAQLQPQSRSQLLATVLEQMKERGQRPNPRTWAETALRALEGGIQGYAAKKALGASDEAKARQAEVLAGILAGDDPDKRAQLAQLGEAGFDLGSGAFATAAAKRLFPEPEDADPFTLSPGQVRFDAQGNPIAEGPEKTEKPSALTEKINRIRDSLDVDERTATGIATGAISVKTDPVTGNHYIVDEATGQARMVDYQDAPSRESGEQTAQAATDEPQTLWESTEGVAGVVGGATELYGQIGGQTGVDIGKGTKETIRNRQRFRTATNDLIRSLSINPRFPVAEMNRIKEEVNIAPSMFDSEQALKERMVTLDQYLRSRLENERQAAQNRNLPVETRQAAATAAKDIENFLGFLGVPSGDPGAGPGGPPRQINSDAEYEALPPGSLFIAPDGTTRKKP